MIRRAKGKDIPKIGKLLEEVCLIHHNGRPDIFKIGRKYSDSEISSIIDDPERPILIYADENDEVMGYCFLIVERSDTSSVLNNIKTLYIDDLCVDEKLRGRHIGKELYEAALSLAEEMDCYNLTLNVWSSNESALRFYEAMGLTPQKIHMEKIIKTK